MDEYKFKALEKLKSGVPLNELSEEERMSVAPGVDASAVKVSEMNDVVLPGGPLARAARVGVDLVRDTSPEAADLIGSVSNPTSMPFKFMKYMGKNEPLTKNEKRPIMGSPEYRAAIEAKKAINEQNAQATKMTRDMAVAKEAARIQNLKEANKLAREEQLRYNQNYAGNPADAVEAVGGFRKNLSRKGPIIHD